MPSYGYTHMMTDLERWRHDYVEAWRRMKRSGGLVRIIIPDCPEDALEAASLDASDWSPQDRAEEDMRDLLENVVRPR